MKLNILTLQLWICFACTQTYAQDQIKVDFNSGLSPEQINNIYSQNSAIKLPDPLLSDSGISENAGISLKVNTSSLDNGKISADNPQTGIKLDLQKVSEGIYRSELTLNGEKESGLITISAVKGYRIESGNTIITLLKTGENQYVIEGFINKVAGTKIQKKYVYLKEADGRASLQTETPDISLTFEKHSFTGKVGNKSWTTSSIAALSSLYLVKITEEIYTPILRKADFSTLTNRGSEQVSIQCSVASSGTNGFSYEDRVVSREGNDIYVCKFKIPYHCSYLNCREPNPHTAPGMCQCSSLCYNNSAENTGSCQWQAKE